MKEINSRNTFHIVNAYSPLSSHGKQELWRNTRVIVSEVANEAICLAGDFSCVRNEYERCNCEYREKDSKLLNYAIKDLNLIEVHREEKFTWFDNQGKKIKLDGILVNASWYALGQWLVISSCRKHSDHKSLLLSTSALNWGPEPFTK